MYPLKSEVTLFDNVTPVAVTSSTDATPIVVTATAHGFVTGQRAFIFGHTTNVAANGIFVVTRLTANTFSLQDEFTGANVAGSGGGAGSSGLCCVAPPVLLVADYANVVISVFTSGTATTTLKVAGSLGKDNAAYSSGPRYDYPNMGGTISPTNPYTYIQVIDYDTAAAVNGVTGLVASGADLTKTYEANINALKYLTVFPATWTQGAITVKAVMTASTS